MEEFNSQFWNILAVKIESKGSYEASSLHLLLSDSTGIVTRERFEHFTANFSPFLIGSPTDTKIYFSNIVKLCKQPWFYGIKSRTQTEAILNDLYNSRRVKNPVVVRLSQRYNYQFCICYLVTYNSKEKKKIQHDLHPPDKYKDSDFYSYFKKQVKFYDYKKGVDSENPFKISRKTENMVKEENPLGDYSPITSATSIIHE